MTLRQAIGAAIVGAALITFPAVSHAVPTVTINGVTVPVGAVLGGNVIESGRLDETLITGSGQTLTGVGLVNSIGTAGSSIPVWQNGQNNTELAFFFTGFVSNVASFPTVTFTGGTVSFYTLPANTDILNHGTVAADIAVIQSGSLWLTAIGAPQDGAGNTLVSNILTGTSLSAFSAADGSAFLNVTGGPAGSTFDTNTFANAFDLANGGFSDMSLTSDFTIGSTPPEFAVSGSATVKANAVPEPLSLAVLGVGLVAVGCARRRRR